jgi:pimeloyl-ACP methyl ester carboxylesterase
LLKVNGISLHVEDQGHGVPVVLLHGWPESSYMWRHQIPVLVSKGFRAISPDMRGLGRSDKPQEVTAYKLSHAVADVIGILDHFGIEAAHIVGHDWGAAVAWMTAALHPEVNARDLATSSGRGPNPNLKPET